MNIKAFVICALATSAALAQPSHRTAVKFGNETVEFKFSNIEGGERMEELRNLTNEATDPAKQEDLWRIRWGLRRSHRSALARENALTI